MMTDINTGMEVLRVASAQGRLAFLDYARERDGRTETWRSELPCDRAHAWLRERIESGVFRPVAGEEWPHEVWLTVQIYGKKNWGFDLLVDPQNFEQIAASGGDEAPELILAV